MEKSISTQPIIDISMTGIHWINASAGTGKTFTLSSVIVRLLLEKYLPKQIIATTFTRKAANELKVRIRIRLQETLNYLLEINLADVSQRIEQENDPLYKSILIAFNHPQRNIHYVIERLRLILDLFDELYVGTLDSFTQKILREFSFESGQLQQTNISEQSKDYILEILHDSLRAWIEQQPQDLINYLHQQGVLQAPENYISVVLSSLNFTSAQWQVVEQPSEWVKFDLAQQVDTLSTVNIDDLVQLAPLVTEFIKERGRSTNKLKFNTLIQILTQKQYDVLSDDKDLKLLNLRYEFKAGLATELEQQFLTHPLWAKLDDIVQQKALNDKIIEQYKAYLQYYLIQSVQQKLSQRLIAEQETTFSEQVQSLANALEGEQGARFAEMVQQRYPVILVDEFQDTNHYQDSIVQRIWRDKARYHLGCCIMVGDDKQAIYGFRGGDMLTYNHARHEIEQLYQNEQKNKQKQQVFFYTLIYNHRTIPLLVDVVDQLFQRNIDFGEQVLYQPIQAGSRVHDSLVERQNGQLFDNHQPLRWLNITQEKKKKNDQQPQTEHVISELAYNHLDQIVWQIQQLLQQAEQGDLYFQSSQDGTQQRPVEPSDIAILTVKNKDAMIVAEHLNRVGIPSLVQNIHSVFDSGIARDVGLVLDAIMNPYQENKIKRALLTQLFAKSIQQIQQLERDNSLSQYMQSFAQMKQNWQQYGFLNAWQQFLLEHDVWDNLMFAPAYQRERLVVNLRHLSDILAHYSTVYHGQHRLFAWYYKQLNAPQEREWEIERKLSQSKGVQVMTIHKSKGLEFKIVFLVSQTSLAEKKSMDLIYSISDEQQRTISIKNQADEQQTEQDIQRSLSENHRLWYVALTRASYRLYLCVKENERSFNSQVGVNYWRLAGEAFEHQGAIQIDLIAQQPDFKYKILNQQSLQLNAEKLPYLHIKEYGKTSFTALALGQNHIQADNLSQNTQFDDELIQELADEGGIIQAVSTQALTPIKRLFPRGKVAGTLLHGLFEKIEMQQPESWASEIQRHFKDDYVLQQSELWLAYQQELMMQYDDERELNYHIKQKFSEEMQCWLRQVVEQPLIQGVNLASIPPSHRVMELKFYLALKNSNLAVRRIEQLFAEYGLKIQLNEQQTARYLEGAIDMVFFDGQRYHILDYKSNYLGDDIEHYQPQALADDMTKHQYWLQASLYLVAIHRYLQVHLANYDIEQHLGMAHYVYLRGVNGQVGQGVYCWQADIEFLLRLDALLGYYEKANQNLSV